MRLNCCGKNSSSARKKKQQATKVSLGTAAQQQQQQQPRRVRLLTPTMKDRARRQSQDSPQQQYGRRHTWQTKGSGSVVVANNPHHEMSASEESLLFASTAAYSMTVWPVLVSASLLVGIYVSCGAALLAADGSKWTYGEAFYFCFVSLFTVGFGGLRPDDSNLYSCVTYIFLGLAVLSTCFFLLKDECFAATRFLREGGRSRKACSKSLSASSSSSTTLALNSLRSRGGRKDAGRWMWKCIFIHSRVWVDDEKKLFSSLRLKSAKGWKEAKIEIWETLNFIQQTSESLQHVFTVCISVWLHVVRLKEQQQQSVVSQEADTDNMQMSGREDILFSLQKK